MYSDCMPKIRDVKTRRPALHYYGGKWNAAAWIISHFPKHENYLEPCGGAASVLIQKQRSKLETYNDLDGNVVNFFRVLRHHTKELIEQIKLTPFAREEFHICRKPHKNNIESARRFFISSWFGIGCQAHNPHTGIRFVRCYVKKFGLASRGIIHATNNLFEIADRFQEVQIDNRIFESVIKRYDNEKTLIYTDPPYLQETRTKKNVYFHEWNQEKHIQAAELLRTAKGFVIVSGYASSLYSELYESHGWIRKDREFQTNSGGKRIESLWLSPKTHEALNHPVQGNLFEEK